MNVVLDGPQVSRRETLRCPQVPAMMGEGPSDNRGPACPGVIQSVRTGCRRLIVGVHNMELLPHRSYHRLPHSIKRRLNDVREYHNTEMCCYMSNLMACFIVHCETRICADKVLRPCQTHPYPKARGLAETPGHKAHTLGRTGHLDVVHPPVCADSYRPGGILRAFRM